MFVKSYQITSEFLELQNLSKHVCRIVSNHIRVFRILRCVVMNDMKWLKLCIQHNTRSLKSFISIKSLGAFASGLGLNSFESCFILKTNIYLYVLSLSPYFVPEKKIHFDQIKTNSKKNSGFVDLVLVVDMWWTRYLLRN